MNGILVVSSDAGVVENLGRALLPDYPVDHAAGTGVAVGLLKRERRDIVIIHLDGIGGQGRIDYKELLRPFWKLYPTLRIVVLTAPEMIRQAVKAVKAGAADYLTTPIVPEEARLVIDGVSETVVMESELEYLRDRQWKTEVSDIVPTRNSKMQKVFDKIRSVAPTRSTVLLLGETGVGKGVLAKLVHRYSRLEEDRFISLHCGAIPENLVESELFGHEKGAFTGAVKKRMGKFEIANNGTLFLDEIGTITPAVQIKLLQVLQDGTFSRVGGDLSVSSDARVVVATNDDLKRMSDEGSFRKDLYYRLNVFPVEIPPLRERKEDIPGFIDFFLDKMNRQGNKEIREVHPLVLEALDGYSWPGNIRELENIIERAYILETSSILTPESLPYEFLEDEVASTLPVDASVPLALARKQVLEDFERQYLKDLMTRNRGKIKDSASEAGITTRQLHKLMKKYGIRKEEFKT